MKTVPIVRPVDLRDARGALGVSLDEVAVEAALPGGRSHLSKIELGKAGEVRFSTMEKLTKALRRLELRRKR